MPIAEPKSLQLRFLGRPMATLAQAGDPPAFALAFDPEFLASNHDLSPLRLPLESLSSQAVIYRAGDSPFEGGLPGLIADSLPDWWGMKVQRAAFPEVRSLLGRLAVVGNRGPGAISYEPRLDNDDTTASVSLAGLAAEADRLARQPDVLRPEQIDEALRKGGSPLGGIHPKSTVFLPEDGDIIDRPDVLVGDTLPDGHRFGVLKFSPGDDEGGGAVEYAFTCTARAAGVNVAQPYLVHDGARRHFASVRFDRSRGSDNTVRRWHTHSLSGFLHKRASEGAIDYEEFIRLARRLAGAPGAEECFRRVVFNLLATNRADHGRNHAFLYDDTTRQWSLSPAYDLNPSVSETLISLAWRGRMEIPKTFAALVQLAEIGGIARARAGQIYLEVQAGIAQWTELATASGVPKEITESWARDMLHQTRALRADSKRMLG
ncbi:MAG TPA: type II toxin-antitoxin system HipA family toxin [Opitutaceae bacterium]|jgi:serine/threonine-protein kinase HipA